jgi:hypothetical protein
MNPYRNDITAPKPLTTKPCSTARSNGVMMRSTQTSADASGPFSQSMSVWRPSPTLYTCLDTETRSAQRHRYLDWAAKAMLQLHPELHD